MNAPVSKIFFEMFVRAGDVGRVEAIRVKPQALRDDRVCALISRLGLAHSPRVDESGILYAADQAGLQQPVPRGIRLFFFHVHA